VSISVEVVPKLPPCYSKAILMIENVASAIQYVESYQYTVGEVSAFLRSICHQSSPPFIL
jgi:hypothetical protein